MSNTPEKPESGLSPTPTTGLSEGATPHGVYGDPNAAALDENADATRQRQSGDEPHQNDGLLPSPQSAEWEDGT